jgi:hypothetical protein
MNTIKTTMLCVVAVSAVWLAIYYRPESAPGPLSSQPTATNSTPASVRLVARPVTEASAKIPAPAPVKIKATDSHSESLPAVSLMRPEAKPGASSSLGGDPIVRDPLAREALSLVGTDAEAERYWIAAINDPTLSARERRNLIEDLNEDGLADKEHLGVNDLPLIISRLMLIEELAPHAMDEVNAEAFAEAYKDLAEMYHRVMRQ